jgi:hypothetical protein
MEGAAAPVTAAPFFQPHILPYYGDRVYPVIYFLD